jgi:hypothetical protein
VAGALGGSFVSYLEFQDIEGQRARHKRFEQLTNSDAVTQERERRIIQARTPVYLDDSGNPIPAPKSAAAPVRAWDADGNPIHQAPAVRAWDANGNPIQSAAAQGPWNDYAPKSRPSQASDGPWNDYAPATNAAPVVLDMSRSIPIPSELELNKSGVKAINWSHDFSVESINTEDGQTLYPTPAPAWSAYALVVIFPILGFFIPWGVIRAVGWVAVGFIQD